MSENNWTEREIKWLEENLGTRQHDGSYQLDHVHLHVTVFKEEYCYRASASDSLNLITTDDVIGGTLKEAIINACNQYNELSSDIDYTRIECDCLIDTCKEPNLEIERDNDIDL